MIEKLDKKMEYVKISIPGNEEAECLDFEAGRKLNLKINELVDAVNGFEKDREEIKAWIGIVSDLRSRVPVVESRVSILEEHAHPTSKVDPYAEQRKWVGKLCWFWDNQEEYKFVGILGEISDNGTYFQKDGTMSYLNCEPVKPDDAIIYKGE